MYQFPVEGGKSLEVFPVGNSLKIKFLGGGELPQELDGIYTSYAEAKRSILVYLDSKKVKPPEVKEAKPGRHKPVLNKEDYAK